MDDKSKYGSLEAALDSFGRDEKRLSVGRVENHAKILLALFGDEVLKDPAQCRVAAEKVERALREIIADIADPVGRRVAQAVFASEEEFYGLQVGQRIRYVHDHDRGFDENQYARQRRHLIIAVAAALQRAIASPRAKTIDVLPDAARHAARQLYRYAQGTLLCIEEYDWSTRCGWKIPDGNRYAEVAQFVPADGGLSGERALWLYAHAQRYLRMLISDSAGGAYLRENLPMGWWLNRIGVPFLKDADWEEMELCLVESPIDEPKAFVERLMSSEGGVDMYATWLEVVRERPKPRKRSYIDDASHVSDLNSLRHRLVALCVLLHGLFPEDAMPAGQAAASWSVGVRYLTHAGLNESLGVSCDGPDARELYNIAKLAVKNRPARHIFGQDEDVPLW